MDLNNENVLSEEEKNNIYIMQTIRANIEHVLGCGEIVGSESDPVVKVMDIFDKSTGEQLRSIVVDEHDGVFSVDTGGPNPFYLTSPRDAQGLFNAIDWLIEDCVGESEIF